MDFKSKEEVVGNLLADVEAVMEELFQSGLSTVHDSTMEALKDVTKRAEEFGMSYLSSLLEITGQGLAMRRHRMAKEADKLAEIFAKLSEYLYLCRQQIAYDRGHNYYQSL